MNEGVSIYMNSTPYTNKIGNTTINYLLLATVLVSLVMAFLMYREHILTGIPLFMTASDGFGQAWPYRAAMSEYLRTEGFPQWHFGIGLGSSFFSPL